MVRAGRLKLGTPLASSAIREICAKQFFGGDPLPLNTISPTSTQLSAACQNAPKPTQAYKRQISKKL